MTAAMQKAMIMPPWPPMAPPIMTSSMVSSERRIVVLKRFIMSLLPPTIYFSPG